MIDVMNSHKMIGKKRCYFRMVPFLTKIPMSHLSIKTLMKCKERRDNAVNIHRNVRAPKHQSTLLVGDTYKNGEHVTWNLRDLHVWVLWLFSVGTIHPGTVVGNKSTSEIYQYLRRVDFWERPKSTRNPPTESTWCKASKNRMKRTHLWNNILVPRWSIMKLNLTRFPILSSWKVTKITS